MPFGQEPVLMCKTHLAVRASGVAAQRMTSFAWERSVGAIVRPRACAVWRLMTSSNVVGCSMALYQHLNHEPQTRRKPLEKKEFQRQKLF
jgi:hypothetical protein